MHRHQYRHPCQLTTSSHLAHFPALGSWLILEKSFNNLVRSLGKTSWQESWQEFWKDLLEISCMTLQDIFIKISGKILQA